MHETSVITTCCSRRVNEISRPDATADARRLRIAFTIPLSFALFLWALKLAEYLGGFDFGHFGIYPRQGEGLAGILFAPFIHGSIAHLFANTPPIVVIGGLLLYAYPRAARATRIL